MRLIADLHVAPRTVDYLKTLGHDVLRVPEVLPATAPDSQIIGRERFLEPFLSSMLPDLVATVGASVRKWSVVL